MTQGFRSFPTSNPISFYSLLGNVGGSSGSGSVTSVALSGSSAFTIVGSPITTSGIITIYGAGSSSQYIDGTGSLQSFPSLSSYVPITRTLTINNTTQDLSANRTWNIAPSGTTGQILAKNSNTDFDFSWIDNYTELLYDTVKADVAINKGQAVYISGANGTNQLASLADNSSEATSSKTLGLALQTMALNAIGPIVTQGLISGINTSTANAGDPVWLGTSGNLIFGLTNKPVAPAHLVYIGVVTRAHAINGEIYVRPQNGFELQELHNVLISGVTNNDVLAYESSTSLWKNKSIPTVLGYTPQAQLNGTGFVKATGTTISYDNTTYLSAITSSQVTTALGYTPVTNARTLTINGTSYDLSADRSWSITAGVSSVSASAPLSSTGGSTPNITISQATTSTNGYLSSTDWNTFNGKQAALGFTPPPNTRTITINGVTQDLSADRTYTISTGNTAGLALANYYNFI